MKIRSKTIAYATMKKKRVKKKEIDLENDIQKLEKSDKSQEDCMIMNDDDELMLNVLRCHENIRDKL